MTKENLVNFASSVLAFDVTIGATTIQVLDATSFPAPPFRISFDTEANLVTAVNGEIFTLNTATQAQHSAGTSVYHGPLAETFSHLFTDTMTYRPRPAAVERPLDQRIQEQINVRDMGAIGDGTIHTLAERYASLSAAQFDYPHATALTDSIDWAAIQLAINYTMPTVNMHAFQINFPAGTYMINRTLNISRGFMNWVGEGSNNAGAPGNGTSLQRYGSDFIMVQATGISITVQTSPFGLVSRVNGENILFDGGDSFESGDPHNGGAHYLQPLFRLYACYEFYFNNCRWENCAGSWIEADELWDSRFDNCIWTFGGTRDGTIPGLWLKSSYPGYETCNNLYFDGNRFESNYGVNVFMDGNNGVDFFFTNCKWENAQFPAQLEYLVKANQATGIYFTNCWMYVSPSAYANLIWTDTGTTATIASSGSFTFNPVGSGINNIYVHMPLLFSSASDPTNFMTGRVTAWTGSQVTVTADYSEGSGSVSSWKISPYHPGLVSFDSCRCIAGNIVGGEVANKAPQGAVIQLCYVRLNNTQVVDLEIQLEGGSLLLPATSFQAWTDTTTTTTPSAGSHTFTIPTGLTLAADTPIYVYGGNYTTVIDYMIGHVVSYNSGASTNNLVISVDPDSFVNGAGSQSSWIITTHVSSLVLQTNQDTTLRNTRIRVNGGSAIYGGVAANTNSGTNEYESAKYKRYGSPETSYRNMLTSDYWHWMDIVPDPQTINGVRYNCGRARFWVHDIARGTDIPLNDIDGNRDFIQYRPLKFIDPNDGTKQTRDLGSMSSAPTDATPYKKGDRIWNSNPSSTAAIGWVCVDPTKVDGTGFKSFGTIA